MTRLLTLIRRLRHRGIDVPRSLWRATWIRCHGGMSCRVAGRLP